MEFSCDFARIHTEEGHLARNVRVARIKQFDGNAVLYYSFQLFSTRENKHPVLKL